MHPWLATRSKRLNWALLVWALSMAAAVWQVRQIVYADPPVPGAGFMLFRLLAMPLLAAIAVLAWLTSWAMQAAAAKIPAPAVAADAEPEQAFMARVVGLQWLNPLQRRDYPTEWQLLWTLGLVQFDPDDPEVIADPERHAKPQALGSIVEADEHTPWDAFHAAYLAELMATIRTARVFDEAAARAAGSDERTTAREPAGLHIEYALPAGRFDPRAVARRVDEVLARGAGADTRGSDTSSHVHLGPGGCNAGFSALAAALHHLQSHPADTVWVMGWDAPGFPSQTGQTNENMLLIALAGADAATDREPLAWIGHPASRSVSCFESAKGRSPRAVQAWQATLQAAAHHANIQEAEIGYVIHDAGTAAPASSSGIGHLAQALTSELPEFDFSRQTFNTPALLGDMGAASALTNLALAVACANHLGCKVAVAGTTDAEHTMAIVAVPPARPRPIDPAAPWYRAATENQAFLPWQGLQRDSRTQAQGFSQ